jgi:hypothetical protein
MVKRSNKATLNRLNNIFTLFSNILLSRFKSIDEANCKRRSSMKRLLGAAILTGAMALQIGATGANPGDKVLVAKKFSSDDEAKFIINGELSPIWSTWGSSNVDDIVTFKHLEGAENSEVTIKAGASNKGLYLYFEVTDDLFFPPNSNEGTVENPSLYFDACDLWFDSKSSQAINNLNVTNPENANAIDWISYAPGFYTTAITTTTKQIGVPLGFAGTLESVFFSENDELAYFFAGADVPLSVLEQKGFKFDLATSGSKKIQEMFIPWSLLGVSEATLNDETNKRMFAFAAGYNDNDKAADLSTLWKLRWNEGADPYAGPTISEIRSAKALGSWGDIEVPAGIIPDTDIPSGIKSKPSLKNSAFAGTLSATEYFTLSGKKIASHNLNNFLNTTVIKRQTFTNGQSTVNRVPLK